MASSTQGIRNTQQLANAAEAFVSTLGAMFPGDTFEQFFHGDTVRRAYWTALQDVLDLYAANPEQTPLIRALLNGQVLSEPRVVIEFLKMFLPGQTPDYSVVAGLWGAALRLPPDRQGKLAGEAQRFMGLLANELRGSNDLWLALEQLSEATSPLPPQPAAPDGDDLNRLLEAALVSGPGTLHLQVRYLLKLAAEQGPTRVPRSVNLLALANLAEDLDPDVFKLLWERLPQISDPALRLRALAGLAPRATRLNLTPDPLALIEELIARSRQAAQPLDPALCVEVLLSLAPHLSTPFHDDVLAPFRQRVLAAVQAIQDAASRVRALGALIDKLPPHLQQEAVTQAFEAAASGIPSEVARAAALSVMPAHLPPEFHTRLLGIAYELEMPDARALLLGRMIPFLSPPLQIQALIGALNAIEQINGDDARAAALIALAPSMDSVGPLQNVPEVLQQAISVTFSVTRNDARARAFAALAPYLSREMLSEALPALRGIQDEDDRAATLAKLAPHLPNDLAVAAFAIAHQLRPFEARASALSAVAPYLSATARAKALEDALAAALSIQRRYDRVVSLVDLAPHLPDALQSRALQEALTATRSIPDEDERARALVFLAPHLPADRLPDALADAYTIRDLAERVPALSALMPYLPPEPRARVAQELIGTAREVPSATQKAHILAAIAPVLPEDLVDEAIQVAAGIPTPYEQVHALSALLPRRPDRLPLVALSAARSARDPFQRVSAMLEVVSQTSPARRYAMLDEVLDSALQVRDDYDRASALANLAPYIDAQSDVRSRQQDALRLALDAGLSVSDLPVRAALLARLASEWVRLLTPAQSYTLWRRAVEVLRQRPYPDLVADLAALVPVLDHMGAPDAGAEMAALLTGKGSESPA